MVKQKWIKNTLFSLIYKYHGIKLFRCNVIKIYRGYVIKILSFNVI